MNAAAATAKRSTTAATALKDHDDMKRGVIDGMTLLMNSVICAAAGRELQLQRRSEEFGLGCSGRRWK